MSSRVLSRGFVHDTFNSLLPLCLPSPWLLGSTCYFLSFFLSSAAASLLIYIPPSRVSAVPLVLVHLRFSICCCCSTSSIEYESESLLRLFIPFDPNQRLVSFQGSFEFKGRISVISARLYSNRDLLGGSCPILWDS